MINNDAEVAASTNLFSEFELTDKQLESISGGFDHDDHRDYDDHDNHHEWHPRERYGSWNRWHRWH